MLMERATNTEHPMIHIAASLVFRDLSTAADIVSSVD